MSGSYFETLKMTILHISQEKHNFLVAAREWAILDCEEDVTNSTACICGKENLRYLFTIKNRFNGKILFPIGSTCIKRFEREDLDDETSIHIALFKLFHAVSNNEFISLSTELFSRKVLYYLYVEGAFNTEYNNYNGTQDYDFILQMFNKRLKESITPKQRKKIAAILLNSIKPYIQELLKDKINNYGAQ